MAARYSKAFMPLSQVKEKEFLSRPMGCKGIGFSFVRCKPGQGATYVHRHKVQEEVFIAQVVFEHFENRLARGLAQTQRVRYGGRNLGRVADRREFDKPDAIAKRIHQFGGNLERQARFAGSAGPGEG